MSRKPQSIYRDEGQQDVARLRFLLGALENAMPVEPPTAETMAAAGFAPREELPPDPFLFRRMIASVEAREARRLARKARR